MPIIVPPINFVETTADVSFEVPLKAKAPAITVTPSFLRVSQGTFITEVDFTGELDDNSVTVTINEPGGVILVRGTKVAAGAWGALAISGRPTPELLARREAALAQQASRDSARRVAASEQRHAAEKKALAQQMGIESDHRALIESKQKDERERAEVRREVHCSAFFLFIRAALGQQCAARHPLVPATRCSVKCTKPCAP